MQEQNGRMAKVAQQVSTCPLCRELVANRTQTVFGAGNPKAEILFIGEAPGREEDRQGVPFVGASGRRLNQLLEAVGIQRDEVYITNVIKCRPPNNRNPLPEEIANCRPYLERQLELIRPQVLCALGSVAARSLLETSRSIGRLRGEVHTCRGVPLVCTYHPAYVVRNRTVESQVLDDLRFLLEQLERKRREGGRG